MPSQQPLVSGRHRSAQQLADIERTVALRRRGLTIDELGELLDLSPSGVYLRLKRARELGLLTGPARVETTRSAQLGRADDLLEAALPFVEASQRDYARRLAWAIRNFGDPRATAEAVAAGTCPMTDLEETRDAA